MIEKWLEELSVIIQTNFWIAPFLALIAGVLASFTPCSLSSIPLIIGYVGGTGQKDTKKAFKISMFFALGSAITFTVLGVTASLAGKLIGTSSKWWYIVLGVIMVLMSIQTLEIFEIIPSSYLTSKNNKKGYLGAFITGILAGVFSSPCCTPILVALLAVVAGKGNLLWGGLLFLMYSIGHGALAVIAGTSTGLVKKITTSKKYGKLSGILKIIMGVAILLIGLYMFYLGF